MAFDEAAVLREQVPEDVDVGVDDPRLAVFVRNVVRMAKQVSARAHFQVQDVFFTLIQPGIIIVHV